MIISTDNELSFALEARTVEFAYENSDRVVACLPIGAFGSTAVSLSKHGPQFHLSAHLPFTIGDDATWKAVEHFAKHPEYAFGIWIDPVDGETKHCIPLREATADELDRCLAYTAACLIKCWDDLKMFDELAGEGDSPEPDSILDFLGMGDSDDSDEPRSPGGLGGLSGLSGLFGR